MNWVKDTAAPAVGGAVSSAANAVVDPDNHKAVKDWVVDVSFNSYLTKKYFFSFSF